MHNPSVYTLDLNFQQRPGTIAAYLIPHKMGAVLVESGPGSTIPTLITELTKHGYKPTDITDVFLTHIHLDHAGASGWLATQGATIHVHPNGAPHMLNPERLLASASRIYGEQMKPLWGDFIPVRKKRLNVIQDDETIAFTDLSIKAIEVPGHADHQYAYRAGDICFSGDIGGIRVNGLKYLSIPMPPPEFHLEKWKASIKRLMTDNPKRIAPTHFGIYNDASWHLSELTKALDNIGIWMEKMMISNPSIEELREKFVQFEHERAIIAGLSLTDVDAMQIANPTFMSADGMLRYWRKYRN